MAFAIRFAVEGICGDVVSLMHVDVRTLAEAKRAFYEARWRYGGVRWVDFREVVAPVSVTDYAMGKRPREAVTSFHRFA